MQATKKGESKSQSATGKIEEASAAAAAPGVTPEEAAAAAAAEASKKSTLDEFKEKISRLAAEPKATTSSTSTTGLVTHAIFLPPLSFSNQPCVATKAAYCYIAIFKVCVR